MSTPYYPVAEIDEICQRIAELGAKTAVVDIEPLVALWNTDQDTLERGVSTILGEITNATDAQALVFATNSARTLPAIPTITGIHIDYLASARKPLHVAAYRDLPLPGVVIGDQVATDGVLARRLNYAFLHYCTNLPSIPRGPRLMRRIGRPIQIALFRSP